MNYLTNYYKNLCEQLQERINILEAGYAEAMRSGNPELAKKELLKRTERQKGLKTKAAGLRQKAVEVQTKKPEATGKFDIAASAAESSAEELQPGIEQLGHYLGVEYPHISLPKINYTGHVTPGGEY